MFEHSNVGTLQTMIEAGVVVRTHTIVSRERLPCRGLNLDTFMNCGVKVLRFDLLFVILLLLESLSIIFIDSFMLCVLLTFLGKL